MSNSNVQSDKSIVEAKVTWVSSRVSKELQYVLIVQNKRPIAAAVMISRAGNLRSGPLLLSCYFLNPRYISVEISIPFITTQSES